MKEFVRLTRKEQTRLLVLGKVDRGEVTASEAAPLLGVGLRQVRRLLAAYRQEGAAALAHGNRGRVPVHTVDDRMRQRVVELAGSTYQGCNYQHLSELLAERDGITLSRSTIRRLLLAHGIRSPRTRRGLRHRQRRERRSQHGMLLQADGSDHDWLEGRGPRLTLLTGIDDATGTLEGALFREQEDAQGYLLLLRQVITTAGCPVALYHDRHGIFVRAKTERQELEEQLRGSVDLTQVGRALAELGMESIAANSPQAKGRIERLFNTLQDRLVIELRLAGATSVAEANQVLGSFVPRFNQQFAVPAATPGTAARSLDATTLETILCFKYRRTVAADNTVALGEHRLQLQPDRQRMSYAKTGVEVQERLDGSLAVYYQGRCLSSTTAPAEAPVLRARGGARVPVGVPPGQERVGAVDDVAVAAAVGSGDKWAADAPTDPAPPQPGRPLIPTPRSPAPDHPWRQDYRKMRVTYSRNR
jgi:transposase